MRTLSILSLFYIIGSFNSYADQNWSQQNLAVTVSAVQKSTEIYQENVTQSSINASLSITKLFNGVGAKFSAGMATSKFSDSSSMNDISGELDYTVSLESRIFLSSVIDVDVYVKQSEKLASVDLEQARFQSDFSSIVSREVSSQGVLWTIGRASQNRSLTIALDRNLEIENFSDTNLLLKKSNILAASVVYSDRISEDSHFLVRVGQRQAKTDFSNTNKQKLDITNAYIGLRTAYLGNSQLDILIGNSHQYQNDNALESDLFSWQIANRIKLSDDFIFNLETTRQFDSSPDANFGSVEQTGYIANLVWDVNQSWSLNSYLTYKDYQFGNDISADSLGIEQSIKWNLSDYLSISSSLRYENLDGSRQALVHDGFNWSLSMSWEIL